EQVHRCGHCLRAKKQNQEGQKGEEGGAPQKNCGDETRLAVAMKLNEALRNGAFAMPLQQGEVRGYDFNRSVVEFTMLNQGKVILCSISTAAMDDLEGGRGVKPYQRVDQFMPLREVIEERASRKFFEEQAQADRPVVLRANDFVR